MKKLIPIFIILVASITTKNLLAPKLSPAELIEKHNQQRSLELASLFSSIKNNDYEELEILLKTFKPDSQDPITGQRTIMTALENRSLSCLKILARHGAYMFGTDRKSGKAHLEIAKEIDTQFPGSRYVLTMLGN